MTNNTRTRQKRHGRIAYRPRYIYLGHCSEGADHLYRTIDETILLVRDGRIVARFDLGELGKTVDDYVTHVRDNTAREWTERRYLADALDRGRWLAKNARRVV